MCTILIIEDNNDIRENTAELLAVNRFNVVTAENGRQGYEVARHNKPDLIICDMMMPESDAQTFLSLAKADEVVRNIPVVFFSAGTPSPFVQRKLIRASEGFLKKPFLEEELLGTIEKVLSNQPLR